MSQGCYEAEVRHYVQSVTAGLLIRSSGDCIFQSSSLTHTIYHCDTSHVPRFWNARLEARMSFGADRLMLPSVVAENSGNLTVISRFLVTAVQSICLLENLSFYRTQSLTHVTAAPHYLN